MKTLPKGKLLIIGGSEASGDHEFLDSDEKNREFRRYEILKEILSGYKERKIEIITTASRGPENVIRKYEDIFRGFGYPAPHFMEIEHIKNGNSEKYVNRIQETDAVFFTGGDQVLLAKTLGGTLVIDAIQKQYMNKENFLVAGTSAGAMAMSSIMIAGGGRKEALFNKDLELAHGLDLIETCIIDTHFIKRGRFSRLAHAIVKHQDKIGIGLGEDSALIIKNGYEAECRGSGMVVIIDGSNISRTNIKTVSENDPIYVENLKVHLLVKGCIFNLKNKLLDTNSSSRHPNKDINRISTDESTDFTNE